MIPARGHAAFMFPLCGGALTCAAKPFKPWVALAIQVQFLARRCTPRSARYADGRYAGP